MFHQYLDVENMPIVIGEKSSLLEPPPQKMPRDHVKEAELPTPAWIDIGR